MRRIGATGIFLLLSAISLIAAAPARADGVVYTLTGSTNSPRRISLLLILACPSPNSGPAQLARWRGLPLSSIQAVRLTPSFPLISSDSPTQTAWSMVSFLRRTIFQLLEHTLPPTIRRTSFLMLASLQSRTPRNRRDFYCWQRASSRWLA